MDWYTFFIVAIAAARLIETRVAARNVRRALARGGVEAGADHYPVMVALHAAFLASCLLEVRLLARPWNLALGSSMLAVVAAAMAVRYWVIIALQGRWTTRVIYVPGDPLVTTGPFRWLRHPNYVAVSAEIAAIPLVHGAWMTAAAFTLLNALVLARRIRVEEELLGRLSRGAGEGR